jgi:hypothetical protein
LVVEVEHALRPGILLQQGFEHGAGLRAVLGEHVALADVLGPLAPGERRRRSKATWQIRSNGSRSLPSSLGEGFERQAFGLQFLDDRLLALAAFQRFRKSSRLAKRLRSAFLVKSRRLSVTSLPFSSRYSTRSAMIVALTPST